jgi:lysophospholipase L1-like esterase
MAAEITNLGESGYVMGQDLATLQSRLKAGDIPDMALFYGGINDVFAAFQSRVAGMPQNEEHRRIEFNAMQPSRPDKALFVATSGLRFLAAGAGRRLMRSADVAPMALDAADTLAKQVTNDLCANRRIVSALAREYGFRASYFLQPVIFGKQQLTRYEQLEAARLNYARSFFELVYAKLEHSGAICGEVPFVNLSHEFDAEPKPFYVDALHLSEAGNARVAAAMLSSVQAIWSPVAP